MRRRWSLLAVTVLLALSLSGCEDLAAVALVANTSMHVTVEAKADRTAALRVDVSAGLLQGLLGRVLGLVARGMTELPGVTHASACTAKWYGRPHESVIVEFDSIETLSTLMSGPQLVQIAWEMLGDYTDLPLAPGAPFQAFSIRQDETTQWRYEVRIVFADWLMELSRSLNIRWHIKLPGGALGGSHNATGRDKGMLTWNLSAVPGNEIYAMSHRPLLGRVGASLAVWVRWLLTAFGVLAAGAVLFLAAHAVLGRGSSAGPTPPRPPSPGRGLTGAHQSARPPKPPTGSRPPRR